MLYIIYSCNIYIHYHRLLFKKEKKNDNLSGWILTTLKREGRWRACSLISALLALSERRVSSTPATPLPPVPAVPVPPLPPGPLAPEGFLVDAEEVCGARGRCGGFSACRITVNANPMSDLRIRGASGLVQWTHDCYVHNWYLSFFCFFFYWQRY